MRPVAQHRLKPALLGQKFSHTNTVKFYDVKCQHGHMLRSAGRRNGVKDRLGKVLTEEYAVLLEVQDFCYLLIDRQIAQAVSLWRGQFTLSFPVVQRRQETSIPQSQRISVTAAGRLGAIAWCNVQSFAD